MKLYIAMVAIGSVALGVAAAPAKLIAAEELRRSSILLSNGARPLAAPAADRAADMFAQLLRQKNSSCKISVTPCTPTKRRAIVLCEVSKAEAYECTLVGEKEVETLVIRFVGPRLAPGEELEARRRQHEAALYLAADAIARDIPAVNHIMTELHHRLLSKNEDGRIQFSFATHEQFTTSVDASLSPKRESFWMEIKRL
jgi:hypothetical protein